MEYIPIICDNISAINMVKKLIHHKRIKHINSCHHFHKNNEEKGLVSIKTYKTKDQVVDIFTKALERKQFEKNYLILGLFNHLLWYNEDLA